MEKFNKWSIATYLKMKGKLQECRGQGTVEYAILVGVLVVIAIGAIMLFRDPIKELWTAIQEGIADTTPGDFGAAN